MDKSIVAMASDHAGFALKGDLVGHVRDLGWPVLDLGTTSDAPVDYPDYAEKIGLAIREKRGWRGILICGSGVGASVAANKIPGIRAGLCHDTYSAHQGVEHDNMNILVLGSRVIGSELAKDLVSAFLNARFSEGERHIRRLEKIARLEERFLARD